MELWTGALSCWKRHWPDLKSAGLLHDRISSWTPLKPQHSIPCWLSVQWEPSACRSCQCCQKKGIIKSLWVDLFCLAFLGLGEPACFHWELCLLVSGSSEHQELRVLSWSARPSPCCHDIVFLSDLLWAPWDKLRAQSPHLQFLANNCVYSSHTDIKLCTYCLYRQWNSLFGQSTLVFWLPYSFHTSHHPSQTPCFPWISYATQKLMLDSCKMVEKQSEAFHTFLWHFSKFKREFYCISFF